MVRRVNRGFLQEDKNCCKILPSDSNLVQKKSLATYYFSRLRLFFVLPSPLGQTALRICAGGGVLDLLNEAGHVLEEEVVHLLFVHLAQLHHGLHGDGHGVGGGGGGYVDLHFYAHAASRSSRYVTHYTLNSICLVVTILRVNRHMPRTQMNQNFLRVS